MSDAGRQPEVSEGAARRPRTRRELMAGLGLAAAAAAIVPSPARATQAATGTEVSATPARDGQILERLLHTERLLQYAYEQALNANHLKRTSEQIVATLLDQEFAHTKALDRHLAALGTSSPGRQSHSAHPKPFPSAPIAALFKHVRSEADSIRAIVEIENLAQYSYFTAVGELGDPTLVRMAAEILASEAQHWTLLMALLHKGRPEASVPHPFVRGSQQLTPL